MNQKGLTPLLIVLLIAAAIGGYLLYSGKINLNNTSSTPVQTTQPSPATDASPAPTGAGETANWKTYSDLINPYTVKYPPDWAYASTTDSVKFFPPGADLVSGKSLEGVDFIHIVPLKMLEFNAKVTEDTKVNVAGQLVSKVTGIEIISDTGTLIHVGPIEYKGSNYLIVFTSGSHKANQKNIDVFDQMLSTFKFTQ